MTEHEALTIHLVLFPDLTQLDLTGPYEVFSRLPNCTVQLVAETLDPVRSERGLTIVPDTTFATAPRADVLCVPGGPGVNMMMEHAPLLAFVRDQAQHAHYVTAVCTGALVLGAAGLLTGYRAATHWLAMDVLPILGAEAVPERVVIDRTRITGGGVTAGIDMALVLVAELCGRAVAERIQLVLEYDPAPPYRSGSPATAPPERVQELMALSARNRADRHAIAHRAMARLHAGAALDAGGRRSDPHPRDGQEPRTSASTQTTMEDR